jgi:hypothetical protein
MVDYNIGIPQQQLFQAPDVMQNAMRMQQMQAQNMQMQQAERAQQQQNAMAAHLGSGGDMSNPEFRQKLLAVGGASAAPLLASIATMEREKMQQRAEEARAGRYASQARTSDFDLQIKERKDMLDRLPYIMTLDDPTAYANFRAEAVKKFGPNITLPETKPTEREALALYATAADALKQAQETARATQDANKPQYQLIDGVPTLIRPGAGTFEPLREAGAARPPVTGGAPVGGAGAPAMPGAMPTPAPAPAPAGFDMDRAKYASGSIESGGRYNAVGPVTNSGDRAFGKYQVMGANIPSWTKEALGRSMTPAEFLASPEAQERVFETYFGKSVAKYGNPADAASVWFSGRPLAKAGNASDVLGMTVPQYVQKFMAAYEGGTNMPAMMRAPGFASSSGIPANVGLPVAPVMNALAGPQPAQQGNALAAPMLQQQPPAPALSPFEEARQTANTRALEKQRAIETMKAEVASKAPPRAMTAEQENRQRIAVVKDRKAAMTTIDAMDDMLDAVRGVRELSPSQKDSITGIRSYGFPLTQSSQTATTKLENLKGKVISLGKQIASVGGSIGSIATQEWSILSSQVASLKTEKMSAKDLDDQLDIIEGMAKRLVDRVRDSYTTQYEELNAKYNGRFSLDYDKPPAGTGAGAGAGVDTNNPLLR